MTEIQIVVGAVSSAFVLCAAIWTWRLCPHHWKTTERGTMRGSPKSMATGIWWEQECQKCGKPRLVVGKPA